MHSLKDLSLSNCTSPELTRARELGSGPLPPGKDASCACCSKNHKHPKSGETLNCDREVIFKMLAGVGEVFFFFFRGGGIFFFKKRRWHFVLLRGILLFWG